MLKSCTASLTPRKFIVALESDDVGLGVKLRDDRCVHRRQPRLERRIIHIDGRPVHDPRRVDLVWIQPSPLHPNVGHFRIKDAIVDVGQRRVEPVLLNPKQRPVYPVRTPVGSVLG